MQVLQSERVHPLVTRRLVYAAFREAYVSIRQHTSAYVSIRQHTSAYVSIRQHTSATPSVCGLQGSVCRLALKRMCVCAQGLIH